MFGAPLFSNPDPISRPGELALDFLTELQKPSRAVVSLLTIAFPPDDSVLRLLPNETTLDAAEHSPTGAATLHEALDDPFGTPDDDTSYVEHDTANTRGESRIGFDNVPEGIVDVLAVRLICRANAQAQTTALENDGSWMLALRVGTTNYFRDAVSDETQAERWFNNVYRSMVIEFETNPDTGVAWVPADLNTVEGVIIGQPDALGDSNGQRWTQMYLEADVTAESVGQFSDETVNSRSEGLFEGKVLGWKIISRSVMGKNNSLEGTSAGAVIADTDKNLSKLIARSGPDLRGSAVTIRLASPDITKADWKTVFTGIVKSWKGRGPNAWDFTFAPEDDQFESKIAKKKINEFDFQDAESKLYDKFAPIIYGKHNSTNISDDGMVQLYRVDMVNNRYLACFGRALAVNNIYAQKNNELPIPVVEGVGADQWQRISDLDSLINGSQWTLIEFPGGFSALDPQEFAFTADVDGYDTVGDGTVTLIINPAEMVKHLLVNFVFNDYQSGLWFADSTAPIDLVKFQTSIDFLNSLGQSSSRYIGGGGNATKAKEELNRFVKNLELKIFWTAEGKIALLPNNHLTKDVFAPRELILEGLDDLEDPEFTFDDGGILGRVLVSYIHQQDGGQFLANIEISDLTIDNAKLEHIQAFWLPSSLPGV